MRPLELIVAFVIAYCLAAVGERVLGRWSQTLADWNIAFLVGLSFTATVFFPLSLALPGNALNVTAAGLLVTGFANALRRRGGGPAKDALPETASFPSDIASSGLVSKALLALAVLLVVQFTVQNYRLTYLWDGFQIWATKAQVLYERGGLTSSLLTRRDPALVAFPNCCDSWEHLTAYPQMVPLFEALVAKFQGRFDWLAIKAVFPFFFGSLLISTFLAARVFVPPGTALAASVLLGLVPAIATRQNVGGYADMPQGALVAGFLAVLFRAGDAGRPSFRGAVPWLLGGVLLVKNEGSILAGLACAVIGLVWVSKGSAELTRSVRRYAGAIAVVLTCFLLRWSYLQWMETKDLQYGPIDKAHLAQAYTRLMEVPRVCAHYMLDRAEWGVFWPVFFLAIPILLWKGGRREIGLAGGTLLALAAYTSIFYFTNWSDVRLHIEQAYSRLLCHLAPAAAVVTVIAYRYLAFAKPAFAGAPQTVSKIGVSYTEGDPNETMNSLLAPRTLVVIAGAFVVGFLMGYAFRGAASPRAADAPAASAGGSPKLTIPAGQPVVGYLNQVEGKTVISVADGGEVHVSGWAGCTNVAAPVAKVEILVDSQAEGSATTSLPRPDVAAAYGRPDFERSGWTAAFPAKGITAGTHPIRARVTCANGDSGTLPAFELVVKGQ